MAAGVSVPTPKKQQGLALLVLVILIVLAASSYFISDLSINQVKTEQENKTRLALKKAKNALIAYAVTHADRPGDAGEMGFLPCPDTSNAGTEGNQDPNCGAQRTASVGYFPWKTLDLPVLADDSGACLMYAVSGTYKLNFPSDMLNEDSNGMFQVVNASGTVLEGGVAQDRVVAIVFAPGNVLDGQSRTFAVGSACGMDYDSETAFLDGDGAVDNGALSVLVDTIDQFIHATTVSDEEAIPYNDRFVTITREEIWSVIQKRSDFTNKMTNLTEALALCLAEYNDVGNNRVPWPAPFALADYRVDGNYSDVANTYAGRVPFIVDDSNLTTGDIAANLFASAGCDNLALTIGAVNANLNDPADEYRKLWHNWKDHFYYGVSSDFEPAVIAAADCAGTCITVGGVEVAGVVFFSGSRLLPAFTRNAPPVDADDKAIISNYIENANDVTLAAAVGDNTDGYVTNAIPNNDIMFCISGAIPFAVGAC